MTSPPASPAERLGVVRRIWRYPVKSLAPEAVDAAEVSWHGLTGDRRWAFVRPDSGSSSFPFHTLRDDPALCRYRAELLDPARPDASGVRVHPPDGSGPYAVDDPALAARLGPGIRVMRLRRGLYDSMPLSLISTATVTELCRRADVPYDPLRFRPNLLVETASGEPFAEDDWVGRTLRIGDTVVRIDRRDPRCTIVNVDPATGETAPTLLRTLADRRAHAGVYASTLTPGPLTPGTDLTLT